LPLRPRDKPPKHHGWQKRSFSRSDFEPDDNVGLKLGDPSGGLVVVDLDDPIALELAPQFLPATGVVIGRPSALSSHRVYICHGLKTRRWKLPGHGSIVELLSTGTQVVVGPSVHPSGEKYDTFRGSPAEVDAVTLLAAVEALYQAVAKRLGAEPAKQQPLDSGPLPPVEPVTQETPANSPAPPRPWERLDDAGSAAQPMEVGQIVGLSGRPVDLERRIRRATAYVDSYPPAISGQGGHSTTLFLTQVLTHRFRLLEGTVLQLLQGYNERCQPPWSQKELLHKIRQAHEHPADKAAEWQAEEAAELAAEEAALANGAESARNLLAEFHRRQTYSLLLPASAAALGSAAGEPQPSIVRASDWLTQEPPPVDSIIPKLLDRGDKFFIVGQSKLGKSFFALVLAICLAAGKEFLGWKPKRAHRVLVVQFELKPAHYWRRVRRVASALGVASADIGDRLDILNLRGKASQLDSIRHEDYDVELWDPLFKLADRAGADENKSQDMARLLAGLDAICERGPAVVIIHHGTKGRLGDKQAIDRASGSGVIARDFDGMFTLAPHADSPGNWLVLESVLRNYRSPEAKTLEFQGCSFTVRDDVPPEAETSDSARRAKQAGPGVEELSAKVRGWIPGPGPEEVTPLIDRIHAELHVGVGKAKGVIRHLEKLGYTRSKTSEFPAKSIITPPAGPLVQGNLSFLLQTGQTGQTE